MNKKLNKLSDWIVYQHLFVFTILAIILRFVFHFSNWCFILPLISSLVFGLITYIPQLGFLRGITWVLVQKYVLRQIKSPLLAYPIAIWLELTGRGIFLEKGFLGFREAFQNHLLKMAENVDKFRDAISPHNKILETKIKNEN